MDASINQPLGGSSNQPLGSRQLFVRNLRTFFTHPKSRAVGLIFASYSIQFGGWATHIPYVKDKMGLNEAELGLTLFALPAGLVSMNPLTSLIINRFSAPKVTVFCVLAYCLCILIPISAPNLPTLIAGLFLTGMCGALLNVAMNTCATDIERTEGISIMSSCHAMWSVGGLAGAGISSLLMGFGVTPLAHMLTVALAIFVFNLIIQRPIILSIPFIRPENPGALFTWPNKALTGMIIIGLAIGMGEGVVLDWSAVYLRDYLHTSAGIAALGFAGFSLMMTTGRFTGDTLVPRFGENRLLTITSLMAAMGLAVAILIPYPIMAILGFTLVGAGCSLGAPILYAASSRVPGLAPGAGLATFATFSFIGFLAGPPLIGMVAESVGLPFGLAIVGFMLLIGAYISPRVKL